MTDRLRVEAQTRNLADAFHLNAIADGGLSYGQSWRWWTDESFDGVPRANPQNGGRMYRDVAPGSWEELWLTDMTHPELTGRKGRFSAYLRLDRGGSLHVHVAADDRITALEVQELVLGWLPQTERPPDDPTVPVSFWSLSPHGPVQRSRRLDVPKWSEVSDNYTPEVAFELELLMTQGQQLAGGGKLILWHGLPGTGKTWALRALASEWRKWCGVHYITDPDDFFGSSANYMMEVLLSDDGERLASPDGDDVDEEEENPWRLLIMEDTGEMLSADAKERAGQGLSRLLNTVDGLIGQGLRIMVLITTNEKVRNLHEAVRRPGRCASLIEFQSFDVEAANAWLENHGLEERVTESATAADLYALMHGRGDAVGSGATVGFG